MIILLSETFLEGYEGYIIFQNVKWRIVKVYKEVEFIQFNNKYHKVEIELIKE